VIGARAVGGVLLAFGVIALVATLGVGDDWSASGPRLAPAIASVLLIVLAAAFVAWPGAELEEHVREASAGTHWPTPVLLLGLLVGYALLLTALGYALATTIFFWLTAWLLGSDRPARDIVIALVLAVVTSYAFAQGLNVQLPTGPWGV
jgi:putative tricarboxylic transport membrane protein